MIYLDYIITLSNGKTLEFHKARTQISWNEHFLCIKQKDIMYKINRDHIVSIIDILGD